MMRSFPSRSALQQLLPTEKKPFSLIWSSVQDPLATAGHYTVLDSSFNPPHRAHASLVHASCAAQSDTTKEVLLVLSTKNVEKAAQEIREQAKKLEMMHCFALDLLEHSSAPMNVSIASLCEPTFVGKSSIILSNLQKGSTLSFILGQDTVTRFFVPRFYPEGTMSEKLNYFFRSEGSSLLWARRPGTTSQEEEDAFFEQQQVSQYSDMIHRIDKELQDISSTQIRKACQSNDEETLDRLLCPQVKDYVRKEALYQ